MPKNRSSIARIISRSWRGILVSLITISCGLIYSETVLILLGGCFIYLSIKYGLRTAKKLEEEKKWNLEYEGRLFFIFASKKSMQDYIKLHVIPKNTDDLIQLFYDGPQIVTQDGPINKYYLGEIYRNNGTVRLFKLESGKFIELEYFGRASEIESEASSIQSRILEIYRNNTTK